MLGCGSPSTLVPSLEASPHHVRQPGARSKQAVFTQMGGGAGKAGRAFANETRKSHKDCRDPKLPHGRQGLKRCRNKGDVDFPSGGCYSPTSGPRGRPGQARTLLESSKSRGLQSRHRGPDRCEPATSVGLGESSGLPSNYWMDEQSTYELTDDDPF